MLIDLDVSNLPHLDALALRAALDAKKTALLVIDIQVDFAAPQGLAAKLGADLAPTEAAIDRIEAVLPIARQAGLTVALVRVVARPETDFPAMIRRKARRVPPSQTTLYRAGSGGEDMYRLVPEADDLRLDNPLFDAFYETGLHAELTSRGITALVLVGVSTDCCVGSTARSAFHRGYDVFVVSDACAASRPLLLIGALAALENNIALLVESSTLITALDS